MLTYADVCWCMLTYADVCWRMLTYASSPDADVSWRMLTYAPLTDLRFERHARRGSGVCWRTLTNAGVCWRMRLQRTSDSKDMLAAEVTVTYNFDAIINAFHRSAPCILFKKLKTMLYELLTCFTLCFFDAIILYKLLTCLTSCRHALLCITSTPLFTPCIGPPLVSQWLKALYTSSFSLIH